MTICEGHCAHIHSGRPSAWHHGEPDLGSLVLAATSSCTIPAALSGNGAATSGAWLTSPQLSYHWHLGCSSIGGMGGSIASRSERQPPGSQIHSPLTRRFYKRWGPSEAMASSHGRMAPWHNVQLVTPCLCCKGQQGIAFDGVGFEPGSNVAIRCSVMVEARILWQEVCGRLSCLRGATSPVEIQQDLRLWPAMIIAELCQSCLQLPCLTCKCCAQNVWRHVGRCCQRTLVRSQACLQYHGVRGDFGLRS